MSQITTPLSGPHTHTDNSVSQIMFLVLAALLPATLFGFYLFGWPAVNLWIITIVSAILSEALCLKVMNKPVTFFLMDGSALLTAWLLALTLPPWAPWWIGAIGGAIAIVMGKQIFGGIGQNIFNPAMLARVALLIAFPVEMTLWVSPQPIFSVTSPDFMQSLAITFQGFSIDSVTGASPLGFVKTELGREVELASILSGTYDNQALALGFVNGSMGETSAILILLGGIFLLMERIISWHIPVSMLATVALLAMTFNFIDAQHYPGIAFHLFSGGLLLAAFFIATDFVTSPNTNIGKIIFGAGCGLLVYVIRTWGGYPEGIAFAVMLMNSLVPLINHYIRPRIYGHTRSGKPLAYSEDKITMPEAGDKQ